MRDLPTTGWVTPPGPYRLHRITITVDVLALDADDAERYAVSRLLHIADATGDFRGNQYVDADNVRVDVWSIS